MTKDEKYPDQCTVIDMNFQTEIVEKSNLNKYVVVSRGFNFKKFYLILFILLFVLLLVLCSLVTLSGILLIKYLIIDKPLHYIKNYTFTTKPTMYPTVYPSVYSTYELDYEPYNEPYN